LAHRVEAASMAGLGNHVVIGRRTIVAQRWDSRQSTSN
jgi:hypothetical protein